MLQQQIMTNYFDVKSIEANASKISQRGDQGCIPKTPVSQMGYLALVRYTEQQLWNMANRQTVN